MLKLKRTLKLVKYDLLAMLKYWWVIALITPIAAVLCAVLFRGYNQLDYFMYSDAYRNGSGALRTTVILLYLADMVLSWISAVIFGVTILATVLILAIRFYKHFYTDEGYLTFTLPVSRRELYLSKVVSSMAILLAQVFIMVLCGIFMLIIIPQSESISWLFESNETSGGASSEVSYEAWRVILNVLLFIVSSVFGIVAVVGSLFTSLTLIHFCITLGAVIVKRGKVFASIGCWYLINEAYSFIRGCVTTSFYCMGVLAIIFIFGSDGFTFTQMMLAWTPFVLMIASMHWTIGFLFYNSTQALIDKKLNLA